MSTKTLRKRIALVAVSALGFAIVPSVSANAATVGTTTMTTPTASVLVGSVASSTFSVTTVGATASDVITYSYAITSKPSDSALAKTGATTTTSATPASGIAKLVAGTETTDAKYARTLGTDTLIDTIQSTPTELGSVRGTIALTPDKSGIYVITVTSTVSVGSSSTSTATFTVYAGYSADSLRVNKAFPTQGSNITTGWTATAGGQATIRFTNFAASTRYYVTTDSGSIVAATERDNASDYIDAREFTNGTNFAGGFNFATDGSATVSEAYDVTITDLGAATTTVTVKTFNAATGAATTFAAATVTWGVAAAASAQYSLLTLNAGAGTTATGSAADTTATVVANTAGTKQFTIQVAAKNQYDVDFTVATLSASITGPGSLGIAQGTASSAALSGRSVSSAIASNLGHVTVFGDGTSGKATITISAGTVVLGTKEVTFVGAPATVTVSQVLFVAEAGTRLGRIPTTSRVVTTAGGITTHAAMRATVLDAGGNPVVAGSTVRIVSSDETVIVPGTCAEYTVTGSTAATVAAPGVFECSVSGAIGAVSGKTATITFEVRSATTGLWSLSATPITFAIGGDIASVALATDKATYAPGEAMTMTATAKDSAGNAPFDGQNPYVSISANMTVVGAPATTAIIVNGVHTTNTSTGTKTMFAPSSVGNLVVSGLTTNASTGTAYSVALKIANEELDSALAAAADAAAEATDAANAATDAANAAAEAADAATAAAQDAADAVAALSTSVTAMVDSLRKQITSLTNLVIKIQRKVRA
jgi:trimeric autotransporter adhesin